jgi:hypothetical protein
MPTGNPNEPAQSVVEIGRVSGVERQLTPEEQQFVDGELQTITQEPMPLIPLEEPPKTEPTLPAGAPYPTGYPIITPAGAPAAPGGAPAVPFTYPILRMNRYSGTDTSWQELVRWDIPDGWVGDLSEISINSSDDTHTKWRFILANVDQNVPTDRPISTPWTGPWRNVRVPGGFTIRVDVCSTDGTLITVDGSITGSVTPVA